MRSITRKILYTGLLLTSMLFAEENIPKQIAKFIYKNNDTNYHTISKQKVKGYSNKIKVPCRAYSKDFDVNGLKINCVFKDAYKDKKLDNKNDSLTLKFDVISNWNAELIDYGLNSADLYRDNKTKKNIVLLNGTKGKALKKMYKILANAIFDKYISTNTQKQPKQEQVTASEPVSSNARSSNILSGLAAENFTMVQRMQVVTNFFTNRYITLDYDKLTNVVNINILNDAFKDPAITENLETILANAGKKRQDIPQIPIDSKKPKKDQTGQRPLKWSESDTWTDEEWERANDLSQTSLYGD